MNIHFHSRPREATLRWVQGYVQNFNIDEAIIDCTLAAGAGEFYR